MKFEDILKGIKDLASSQGFYSRLYRDLMQDKEYMQEFKKAVMKQKFTDFVEFIMWLEG